MAGLLCLLPQSVHAAEGGLNLFPNLSVVALQLALFIALIYPTNRWLLQPLLRIFEERERRTEGAIREALRLDEEAAGLRRDFEQRLDEARGTAQRRRGELLGAAEEQARGLVDAARTDASRATESVRTELQSELETARVALREQSRALAKDVAGKVLGRQV